MDVLSFLLIIVAAIIGAAISYFFFFFLQTQMENQLSEMNALEKAKQELEQQIDVTNE